jgi:hypothetical protein
MTDEEIVARAVENGWVQEPRPNNALGPGGMWRREGHGIPYGTFKGPRWATVAGKRVKVDDSPTYTVSPADVMREKLADHDDRCGECGRWIEYGGQFGFERSRAPLPFCWLCSFWLARVNETAPGKFVSQSFTYYGIGSHKTPSPHNGFGGSWWVVRFLADGREVETCDLWCGGEIPERFRDRLPVTADLRSGRLSG